LPTKYKNENENSNSISLNSHGILRSMPFMGTIKDFVRGSSSQIASSTSAGDKSDDEDENGHGKFLDDGDIFGVEQHILDERMVTSDVYSMGSGLVGVLEDRVFDALKRVDVKVVDAIRVNLISEMLETVKPSVPFLAALEGSSEMRQLASVVKLQTHAPTSVVHHQGSKGDYIYIVVCGAVEESTKELKDDGSYEVAFKGIWEPGSYIGEVAIVTDSPYPVTNTAIDSTVLLCISSATFRTLYNSRKWQLAELKCSMAGRNVNLADILDYEPGYSSLMEYLTREHATENLHFITHVDRFLDMAHRLQDQLISEIEAELVSRKQGGTSTRGGASQASTTQVSTRVSSRYEADGPSTIRKAPAFGQWGANASSKSLQDDKSYIVAFNSGMLELKEVGKSIMDKFIRDNSDMQVNIPGEMRIQSEGLFKEWLEMSTKLNIARVETLLLEFKARPRVSTRSVQMEQEETIGSVIQSIEDSITSEGIGSDVASGRLFETGPLIPPANLALRIFASPREEIFNLIKRDTLPRWKQSPLFETYVSGLKKHENTTIKATSSIRRDTRRNSTVAIRWQPPVPGAGAAAIPENSENSR